MRIVFVCAMTICTWLSLVLLWFGLSFQATGPLSTPPMIADDIEKLRERNAFDLPEATSDERSKAELNLSYELYEEASGIYTFTGQLYCVFLIVPTVASLAFPYMLLRRKTSIPPSTP